MKFGKILVIPALVMLALPAIAQILPISEQEQNLLGIRVQTVTAVDQGDAGEITLRVAFASMATSISLIIKSTSVPPARRQYDN